MPFNHWGPSHLAPLAIIFVLSALIAIYKTHLALKPKLLSIVILIIHIPYQILALSPKYFSVYHSLPLHLCDLAWMVCSISLWTNSRWSLRLIYYWGLTLTPQALLTPALSADFPSIIYFGFWFDHGIVFIATIYIFFVLKFRPDISDFWKAYAFTISWGLLVLSFNFLFKTNYMFLNIKPARSLLDYFGPWPYYLATEAVLTWLIWYFLLPRKSKPS